MEGAAVLRLVRHFDHPRYRSGRIRNDAFPSGSVARIAAYGQMPDTAYVHDFVGRGGDEPPTGADAFPNFEKIGRLHYE